MSATIRTLRGAPMEPEAAEAIRAFWGAHGGPRDAAADARLGEVVCVATEQDGAVVGVNSVFAAEVPPVDRWFWVYRSLVDPALGPDVRDALLAAAFTALDAEFASGSGGPVGLCLLVADRDEMTRRPEFLWEDPPMLYAGYLQDGRQVRIAYFEDARIGPGTGDG